MKTLLITVLIIFTFFIMGPKRGKDQDSDNDAPESFQFNFQDPSTSTMEGVIEFNNHLLLMILLIICLISWLLFITIKNFSNSHNNESKFFFHSSALEIIWTLVPAFILLTLASLSFTLLYSMKEISDPELSLKKY